MNEDFLDWGFAVMFLIWTFYFVWRGLKAEEEQKRRTDLCRAAICFLVATATAIGLCLHWCAFSPLLIAIGTGVVVTSGNPKPKKT